MPGKKYIATGFSAVQNTYAVFIVMGVRFILEKTNNICRVIVIVTALYLLTFNEARATILALIIILILWPRNILRRYMVVAVSFSLIFLLHFIIDTTVKPINQVYKSASDSATLINHDKKTKDSVGIRVVLIEETMKKNILLGEGPGGSVLRDNVSYSGSLHLYWLEVIVDAGLAGMMYIILIGYLIIKLYLSQYYTNKSYVLETVSLSLIGVVISSVGTSSIVYFIPFWFLLGLAVVLGTQKKHYKSNLVKF